GCSTPGPVPSAGSCSRAPTTIVRTAQRPSGRPSPPSCNKRQNMDLVLYLKALALGVVEGLTEFLPISSTGHLILAGDLLDFNGDKAKVFEIVIQTGAMLAIIWEYRARFLGVIAGLAHDRKAQRFVANLVIA